jgi:hypothetical protein
MQSATLLHLACLVQEQLSEEKDDPIESDLETREGDSTDLKMEPATEYIFLADSHQRPPVKSLPLSIGSRGKSLP